MTGESSSSGKQWQPKLNKKDIIHLIKKDEWMMNILEITSKLSLSDWWIGAGFVRSKIWDTLHGHKERTPLPDVDVIYFNPKETTEEKDKSYELKLKNMLPSIKWSVKNQARMHLMHDDPPYKNSAEGLSRWVETATCVGASLKSNGEVVLLAPHGIDDLVNLILRPTDINNLKTFNLRVKQKGWLKTWPKLRVEIAA